LSGAVYDNAGNQTGRGSRSATWDGFGMMTSYQFDGVNTNTYVYVVASGNTGNGKDEPPHVHLSVFVDGKKVDPQKWFAQNPSNNEWEKQKK
jgi:hypothetical protein